MRILYESVVYPPYISGAVTFLQQLMNEMVSMNHYVGVLTPSLERRPGIVREAKVTEYYLPAIHNPFRLHHTTFLPHWKAVCQSVKDFKPDILHFNDPFLFPVRLAAYARENGIKTIMTQHAFERFVSVHLRFLPKSTREVAEKIIDKNVWRWSLKVLSFVDVITVPSVWLRDYLVEGGVPEEKVEVFSNGVDLRRFFPVDKYRQSHELKMLYFGRLDHEKSLELLVQAMPKLRGCRLILAGAGGTEIGKIQRMVFDLNVGDRVVILGRVPEDKLLEVYQSADVFVMPSTVETQSITTLQALACGLPVIAAKAGALPELVENGKNGFLFQPFDSDDFAKKTMLLRDKVKLIKMRRRSRVMAKKHELHRILHQWQRYYFRLLD